MKYFFRIILLFLFTTKLVAGTQVILITYHPDQKKEVALLKKVMQERMSFPSNLITFKQKDRPCDKMKVAAAHICIRKDGEFYYPKIDTKIMKETLGAFWIQDDREIQNEI